PVITSQITIEGNGATIHRDGNAPAFGLVRVRGNIAPPLTPPAMPGDLTLQGVTLSGGSSFGGLSNDGTLSIKNSIISGNTGRGINNNFLAALTIENSAISGNTGGGVSNGGNLTVANSTISNNTTNFDGGGVSNYPGGTVAIANSTVSGNHANRGGGVSNTPYFLASSRVTITNSPLSGNVANAP